MTNMKEIALFPKHSIGFYPKKLKAISAHSSYIEMIADILPKYIREQESLDVTTEEAQRLYNGLKAGESFRIGTTFYNAEMIYSNKFKPSDHYIPTTVASKETFEAMKPLEVIKYRNKEFRKSETDEYIYVYELMTSTCQLVGVDTDRPWTIGNYDGAEYIEYLDYILVDEKLNYCKRKGE